MGDSGAHQQFYLLFFNLLCGSGLKQGEGRRKEQGRGRAEKGEGKEGGRSKTSVFLLEWWGGGKGGG